MGRDKTRRLSGSRHLRQRLVLATLTSTGVTIDDIRSGDAAPGLRPYEVSLLRLLDKISDRHTIDLNETGMASRELRLSRARPPQSYVKGCRYLRAYGACM